MQQRRGIGATYVAPNISDEEMTVVAAQVKDNYNDSSLERPDERLVVTSLNNIVIDSGADHLVLDEYEAGELQSISIVSDNPYLQAFLQIDNYRNGEPHGECAAEILYNSGVIGTSERRFQAVDGQSPTVGY